MSCCDDVNVLNVDRGTYLSDLTFTEDGNPDHLKEDPSMINWQKRTLISKFVNQIKLYQQSEFNFPVVEVKNFNSIFMIFVLMNF